MNSTVTGLRVASAIFGLVSLGQLARLLLQLDIIVAGHHLPLWLSGVAVLVGAALCAWLWRLSVPAHASAEHPAAGNPSHPTPA